MIPVTPFPREFVLHDFTKITAPVFELKRNPYQNEINEACRGWFKRFDVYSEDTTKKFLDVGKFDIFAVYGFPDAISLERLKTCLAFFLWAFSTDDYSDEGEHQASPEGVKANHEASLRAIQKVDLADPETPYAAMLQDLCKRLRGATPAAYQRFVRYYEQWGKAQIEQSRMRSVDRIPSVSEFIPLRRITIGNDMVESIVEYALNVDLPDLVMEHPIVSAMSDALNDLTTWPNDLCSFNKEQADGDLQNLVYCVMMEEKCNLQKAVDIITDMLQQRVRQYIELKKSLPSFGPEIDASLAKFLHGMEQFTQGTLEWYIIQDTGVDWTSQTERNWSFRSLSVVKINYQCFTLSTLVWLYQRLWSHNIICMMHAVYLHGAANRKLVTGSAEAN